MCINNAETSIVEIVLQWAQKMKNLKNAQSAKIVYNCSKTMPELLKLNVN